MERLAFEDNKLEKLISYYKGKGLLIVGLNDSQGVNTTSTFFKKGLLEHLALMLTSDELKPMVIDAFSLIMNKTEHIDYILKNNLSVEEIKLSQICGVVKALEKVMEGFGLPKFLGEVGSIYRLVYTPKNGDDKIHISTALRQASEPVLIYSCGVNNLMRIVGSNPYSVIRDYKARDKRPNYYFTLEKATDVKTLMVTIDDIEKNFNNILGINASTDIYALGAYIPKSLQSKDMGLFRDLIIKYNNELSNLCSQYGVTFIDTGEVGKEYNHSKINFHVSSAGHNTLANYILECMYQNKIVDGVSQNSRNDREYEITDDGVEGVINSLLLDYEQSYNKAMKLSGYAQKRELAIASEHEREAQVFQKVLKKTRK